MSLLFEYRNIDDKMLWKDVALYQFDRFEELETTDWTLIAPTSRIEIQNLPQAVEIIKAEVIGTHTSKSCKLPVVKFEFSNGLIVVLRDNFYDINIWVSSEEPINLPLHLLFCEKDMEWYQDQVNRCRNYTYRGWNPEEIENSGLCKSVVVNTQPVKLDEKERWCNRWVNTEWYGRDWSGGTLIVERAEDNPSPEPFGPETKFYHSNSCYAEGMGDLSRAPCYSVGTQCFIMYQSSWEEAKRVIKNLLIRH